MLAASANWVASNLSASSIENHAFNFGGQIFVQGDPFFPSDSEVAMTHIGGFNETLGPFPNIGSQTFRLDLDAGNVFKATLGNGANSITQIDPQTGRASRYVVLLQQPSSGAAGTLTSVPWTWIGATPLLSVTNNAVDEITLVTPDGTNFYGFKAHGGKRSGRILALAANSATPAINTDLCDIVHITAQTAAITSFTTNLTGTPIDGDVLRISITGTASVALTWGTSFESSTVTLPTTTSSTARLDVGFAWNSETSKWRCLASA
jgi:hypothetical protein